MKPDGPFKGLKLPLALSMIFGVAAVIMPLTNATAQGQLLGVGFFLLLAIGPLVGCIEVLARRLHRLETLLLDEGPEGRLLRRRQEIRTPAHEKSNSQA